MADKYKPTWVPAISGITRNGYVWTANWKVNAAATDNKKENRFDGQQIRWTLDFKGDNKDIIDFDITENESRRKITQRFKEWKGNWKPFKGKALSRDSFYPVTSKKLHSIKVRVRGYHTTGSGQSAKKHWGDWSKAAEYVFKKPTAPKITASYNDTNHKVSYAIETEAGNDAKERYDTRYRVYLKFSGNPKPKVITDWTASDKLSIKDTIDLDTHFANWSSGKTVAVHIEAYARGIAGDSATMSKVLKVAWPTKPSISDVIAAGTGQVRIKVSIPKGGSFDTVQLQRQLNVVPGNDPAADGWGDVEGAQAKNDSKVRELYDIVGNAKSSDGLETYYRLKVEKSGFIDYSDAFFAKALFTAVPTAGDDKIAILDVASGRGGASVDVLIGINEDSPNTGTEIAWSQNPDALRSTEEPNMHRFERIDSTEPSQQYPGWSKFTSIIIDGLKDGETYYIWARRYLVTDAGETHTGWSESEAVVPSIRPTAVSLAAETGTVARGEPIVATWTYDGTAVQTAYAIHPEGDPNSCYAHDEDAAGRASISPEEYGDATSISFYVTVEVGGVTIDSEPVEVSITDRPRLDVCMPATITEQGQTFEAYADSDTCKLAVACSVNADSNITEERPDGPIQQFAGDVLWASTVQPMWELGTWGDTQMRSRLEDEVDDAASALADAEDALTELWPSSTRWAEAVDDFANALSDLSEANNALEAALAALEGMQEGDAGYDEAVAAAEAAQTAYTAAEEDLEDAREALDALATDIEGYSDAVADVVLAQDALDVAADTLGEYPADGETYIGEVGFPVGIPFIDNGKYAISATATDDKNGLSSEPVESLATVEWARQAIEPPDDITITADSEAKSVTIQLAPFDGAIESDRYDLYRGTADGYVLVAENLGLSDTVTDRYAAFGSMAYCICTRTQDGDRDYREYDYTLDADVLRFDWQDGFLELDRSVEFSDTSTRRFQSRVHSDGSVGAYYNLGVDKSGSYTAKSIDIVDQDDVAAVADMGNHAGCCYCRTGDGKAFQCNVDITDNSARISPVANYSFSVTRVDLTRDYAVQKSDIAEGV